MTRHERHKELTAQWRSALRSGDLSRVSAAAETLFAPDAVIKLGYPFGEVRGPEALINGIYAHLFAAMPDMERGDFIVMAGREYQGKGDWIGLGGNVIGTFTRDWLGIPATGQPAFFRYHEYLRFDGDQVVEMEALWDLPQLMIQAGAWPMAPQLGVEWICPGPSTGNGVKSGVGDPDLTAASLQLVWDMLHDLKQGTAQDAGRGLTFWHSSAPWYGPAGIGTARGPDSIRRVVLQGFREGLSENTRHLDDGVFFAEGDLVAFTGWPSATATHSGDGFLGLAPTGQRFERRSLDFWRVEDGLIRENWVMVDMLDLYRQLGVDVFARMRRMLGAEVA